MVMYFVWVILRSKIIIIILVLLEALFDFKIDCSFYQLNIINNGRLNWFIIYSITIFFLFMIFYVLYSAIYFHRHWSSFESVWRDSSKIIRFILIILFKFNRYLELLITIYVVIFSVVHIRCYFSSFPTLLL